MDLACRLQQRQLHKCTSEARECDHRNDQEGPAIRSSRNSSRDESSSGSRSHHIAHPIQRRTCRRPAQATGQVTRFNVPPTCSRGTFPSVGCPARPTPTVLCIMFMFTICMPISPLFGPSTCMLLSLLLLLLPPLAEVVFCWRWSGILSPKPWSSDDSGDSSAPSCSSIQFTVHSRCTPTAVSVDRARLRRSWSQLTYTSIGRWARRKTQNNCLDEYIAPSCRQLYTP